MERFGWAVLAGAVVLLAIVTVVVLTLRSARRMPVEDDDLHPEGSGYAPLSEIQPVKPALGSEDENAVVVKVAWERIISLMESKPTPERPRAFASGGRFHRRDGVQFTVVHAEPWCVIVRWKKGDNTVTRVLVNKNAPHVLCAKEDFERLEMEGGRYTSHILAIQASIATSPDAVPMMALAMLDLTAELTETVYQGTII